MTLLPNMPALRAIVIGGSAGALDALGLILPALPSGFLLPIALVLHLPPTRQSYVAEVLRMKVALSVKEVDDKEPLTPGLFVAPPNYHLLLEAGGTFALSVDEPVHYSRPSIDVLFESAADAYGSAVAGVLLSGANDDGARGLLKIKEAGGVAIVQSPDSAQVATMPEAALALMKPDYVLSAAEIGTTLALFGRSPGRMEMR